QAAVSVALFNLPKIIDAEKGRHDFNHEPARPDSLLKQPLGAEKLAQRTGRGQTEVKQDRRNGTGRISVCQEQRREAVQGSRAAHGEKEWAAWSLRQTAAQFGQFVTVFR